MRRCFTDPHYWKSPALRRSRERSCAPSFCKLFLYQMRGHHPQAKFQGNHMHSYIVIEWATPLFEASCRERERGRGGEGERGREGERERGREGERREGERERGREGERERWRDGEMERWRDGEMERWRDGEMDR